MTRVRGRPHIFLALLMLTLSSFFLLFLPFFYFDLNIVCFILPFFLWYYAISSVSLSAATRLAHDICTPYILCILIRTYADITFLFLSEVYDLFQLLCVLSSVFVCFPRGVIFRSRVIGVCPVTTNCFVATS